MKGWSWCVGARDPQKKVDEAVSFPFSLYCGDKLVAVFVQEKDDDLTFVSVAANEMASQLNTQALDIARAVKAALVEHCKERKSDPACNDGFGAWSCGVTLGFCECSVSALKVDGPVDPLGCPLVRRVLDALGMGGSVTKKED